MKAIVRRYGGRRSEEHTSELHLPSLSSICSQYFPFCVLPPYLLTIAFILLPLRLFILFHSSSPFSFSRSPTTLQSPFCYLAVPLSSAFPPFAKFHSSFSISKNLHYLQLPCSLSYQVSLRCLLMPANYLGLQIWR